MSNIPWKIFNHNDVKILRCRFILVFSDIGEKLINHLYLHNIYMIFLRNYYALKLIMVYFPYIRYTLHSGLDLREG